MSAGLIPFCKLAGQAHFLFQKTFTGRKVGYYIDFGGGSNPGETATATAAREFVEETATLFFSEDLKNARRTELTVRVQSQQVLTMLSETLNKHPDWWSKRRPNANGKQKDWQTFFMQVSHRDVEPLNIAWQFDTTNRFKKRRELHWVSGDQLLQFYAEEPRRLWKRVRELERGPDIVKAITTSLQVT